MRIQHNIMAMSAYRNYTNNVNAMKKNLEKLSSGYKINRAGDDAAGLAISEKMRAQITGLQQAQANAKSGINLVQTAEGALTEVHDMLNRMVKLADQSANGTFDDTTDRDQLQKELNQLRSEIDRISKASNFNGIKLLDGSMDGSSAAMSDVTVTSVTTGSQGGQAATAAVYEIDLKDLASVNTGKTAIAGTVTIGGKTIGTIAGNKTATGAQATFTLTAAAAGTVSIKGITYDIVAAGSKITLTAQKAPTSDAEIASGDDLKVAVSVKDAEGGADGATGTNHSYDLSVHMKNPPRVQETNKVAQGSFTLSADQIKDGAQIKIGKDTYTFKVGANGSGSGGTVIDLSQYEVGDDDLLTAAYEKLSQQTNTMFDITTDGTKVTLTEKLTTLDPYKSTVDYKKDWDLSKADGWGTAVAGGSQSGAVVQMGSAGKGLTLQIGDTSDSFNQLSVNIKATNCAALGISGISIAKQTEAQAAVDKIRTAINKVSDIRGTLGATQNRLDHTINNLSVMTENIQDAESTIRDTDVAEEMMAYTKNNILIQSAQAMLAQANQVPQGVLQLLQ